MRLSLISAIAVALLSCTPEATAQDKKCGYFEGDVVAKFLNPPEDRLIQLVAPYEYIDTACRRWFVPSGTKVDGASIPSVFWSIIGGPFEGLYRNASVIHDYYCEKRTRKAPDVHKVFFDAMLQSGVEKKKANLMYLAVKKFGPYWPDPKSDPRCEDSRN